MDRIKLKVARFWWVMAASYGKSVSYENVSYDWALSEKTKPPCKTIPWLSTTANLVAKCRFKLNSPNFGVQSRLKGLNVRTTEFWTKINFGWNEKVGFLAWSERGDSAFEENFLGRSFCFVFQIESFEQLTVHSSEISFHFIVDHFGKFSFESFSFSVFRDLSLLKSPSTRFLKRENVEFRTAFEMRLIGWRSAWNLL